MGLDDRADVGGQLGVLLLCGSVAFGFEVLDATDATAGLLQPRSDRFAPPAKAGFGGTRVTATQSRGDFGLEQAALVALQAARRRTDQALVLLCRGGHGKLPPLC